MDFNARAVAFSDKEFEENSLDYLEWMAKTKKSIELQKVKRCASGIGEQEIDSEERLSVNSMKDVRRNLFNVSSKFSQAITSAYNTVAHNGRQQSKPNETAMMIEQVIGRTHGLIKGHGIPITEAKITQSQRMFEMMTPNTLHQIGGQLLPITLCSFTNQRTKTKEEDTLQMLLSKTADYGNKLVNPQAWYGISCVLEGIDVDSGTPSKQTGQVILSTLETAALIKNLKHPSDNLQRYFGLSLGWIDPSEFNDSDSDTEKAQINAELAKHLQSESYKQLCLDLGNDLI